MWFFYALLDCSHCIGGGARLIGCEAGEAGSVVGGFRVSIAWFGLSNASLVSWVEYPSDWAMRFVDFLRFCFCVSNSARKSRISWRIIAAPCIWSWAPLTIWSKSLLIGLCECCLSNALIDEAFDLCLRLWGLFGDHALDWLTGRPT